MLLPIEAHRYRVTRIGPAPHRHGSVALQNRVVREDRRQAQFGLCRARQSYGTHNETWAHVNADPVQHDVALLPTDISHMGLPVTTTGTLLTGISHLD
jgi:hypothetical protein